MRASTCLVLALLLGACAVLQPEPFVSAEQARAFVDNPIRTDRDRQMDASRKPTQFLAFAQVGPGMRVLDVSAGAGYTTQIMALAVGPSGKVWAQSQNPPPALTKRLADHPQANVVVSKRPFEDPVPERGKSVDTRPDRCIRRRLAALYTIGHHQARFAGSPTSHKRHGRGRGQTQQQCPPGDGRLVPSCVSHGSPVWSR